ncbi:phospholipase A2 [Diachasma alloeum]|uniref:phospholipase A2 n=1 Tax=Diachasma alloeum TaxID=454923 RepID=UPI0007384ECE|nr:phospholipase A2 [Diachasma alloeum]
MLGSTRKNALLFVAILLLLEHDGVRGEDQCDPDTTGGKEVETYRSGLERLIQGLGGIFKDVSGGDEDGSSDPLVDTFSSVLDRFKIQVHAIFPGTLWCGAGDIAPNSSFLGPFDHTDACCRSHDECPTEIPSSGRYGPLRNNGIFTRSACGCDHVFFQCLKRANSIVSSSIGNTYFNILRPQCFTCDYPIVSCARRDRKQIFEKKCLAYNLDTTQPKRLQWFDNPNY